MSTVVKDLGAVSAYAYAVEKGYTGTEAEFAELMADYAEVGQRAEDAADSALESNTAAQTAANTATTKASEATTAAQTATTKAGEASQSASQAQTSAQTASTKASEASQSATTATEKATEATTAADTATTAKNDAVSAKNAAETAKTAAETAQEAAEDAAESVSASAAQIATNTADISDIKENFNESVAYSIPSISGWISNTRIIVTGDNKGEIETNRYYDCTDFILIVPSLGNLSITAGDTSWFGRVNNAWYDKDKKFISAFSYNSNTTVVVVPPSNAKYFRITRGKEGTSAVPISISVPYEDMSVADWISHIGKDDIRIYFEQGANPTISNLSYSSITVTLKNAKLIVYDSTGAKEFSASDILTAASAFGLTVDLEALTFTGDNYAFVYNYKTHSIYFRNPYAAISAFEINLLTRMYTSLISGRIYDIISNAQKDQNGKNIKELQSVAFPQVPSFFTSQLSTAITNIKSDLQTVGRNGDNFVFITDIHWNANFKRSPELIRKLSENKLVNLIVNVGDLIDGSANKNEELQRQTDCIDAFNKAGIPMITAKGNHDMNSGYGTSANYFNDSEYFATAQHGNALVGMEYGGDCYFYWDKKSTKTRYIVLDSGANNIGDGIKISQNLITWTESIIADTPVDYHIIIIVHALGAYRDTASPVGDDNQFVYASGAKALFDSLDSLLSTHKIEAVFFGHTHYDANYNTNGGIPLISTNSDSRHQYYGMPSISDGNVNSQCFDVVTIDYNEHKIYMRRVGRGSDRIITY